MRNGKISQQVLVRSVLKKTEHRRKEVLAGPGVGRDCALVELGEDELLVLSADSVTCGEKEMGRHSVYTTTNNLAAAGAEPIGVMVSLMLSKQVEEKELRSFMEEVEDTCKQLNIEVMGGHTQVTPGVNQILVSLTGVGKVKKNQAGLANQIEPGDDLIVTKWIGLEGTSLLAKKKEKQLCRVFRPDFVRTAAGFDQFLSVISESQIAGKIGVDGMHDLSEGGIFAALWELAEGAHAGLDIDLKKIPIRQESIEVCEQFGINPYILLSGGSLLIAAKDGQALVHALGREGIHSAVIGKVTEGNDRILRNGEEIRYLDRPMEDEIYKIL